MSGSIRLNLRLYSMRSIRILRALIERVQTFNNEIVRIQPKYIENVPKNCFEIQQQTNQQVRQV